MNIHICIYIYVCIYVYIMNIHMYYSKPSSYMADRYYTSSTIWTSFFRHRGSVSSDIDLGWGMKRAKPLEKSGKVNSGRVKHGTSNKTRWKIGRIRTCKELIKNMCVALPSADLGPPKIPDMSACTHGNPSWLEPENGGPIWKTRGRLWQPFSGQPSGCFIVACYAMTYYIL